MQTVSVEIEAASNFCGLDDALAGELCCWR